MTNFLNLPSAEQKNIELALLASIASNIGDKGIKIESWKDFQMITRMGLHRTMFKIGDTFKTTYGESHQLLDVIGIDHDGPNSITLQFRDCIINGQFDAPEALYKVGATALEPGTYNFVVSGTRYSFTLTKPVPAGGCLTFPWAYNTDILTTKVSSFPSQESTVAIETVGIVVGTTGTQLTDINHIDRCRYGSNNYKESAVRQWLNSREDSFVWKPQTNFDRPPTSAFPVAGFLKLIDPELASVISPAEKKVARNTVTDGGGQDTFKDRVFLLSQVEVGLGAEGTTTGETVYGFWNGATAADRIKVLGNSSRQWWLRSPYVGNASTLRFVAASGALSHDHASIALGLSPACKIS